MSVAIAIIRPAISGTLITFNHEHSRAGDATRHIEELDKALLRSRGHAWLHGPGTSAPAKKADASAEPQQ